MTQTYVEFERKAPNEETRIAEITGAILTVQARFALQQHRRLGRGTHTKGTCVRGVFEVFDLRSKIPDQVLASRLARGIFAHPGRYPATIRFANGASTVNPDSTRDVRAMSFSIEVPAGLIPEVTRLDFTMNDAPTFPINDAEAFAALMKVLSADGRWSASRALWELPFPELKRFFTTAIDGRKQQHRPRKPYQQTRYWSTVPFLHGGDEAIKYSALPSATNEGKPLQPGPDELKNELLRHLAEASEPATFDFALQLLEPDRMKWKGERQPATFWVENASIEWNESESPFHVVGQLRLLSNSALSDEECASMYIDVTKHAVPGNRPIGSINRARWAAESASRKARLAAVSAPIPVEQPVRLSLRRRIGNISLRTLVRATLAVVLLLMLGVAGLSLGTMLYLDKGGGMLPAEAFDRVEYLDQGWGTDVASNDRQTYYYTAQGAGLRNMRYSWFVNLEMPWGKRRFADPEVLRRYGFILDPPTPTNPDGLPVGFTKHFDRQMNEEILDITCAACHTGQLNVSRAGGGRTAIRVDGGPAMHAFTDADFGNFVPTMVASMVSTAANPLKFNRFARKVLGDTYPEGRWQLHGQLRQVIATFGGIAFTEKWHRLYPTQEGYGRTDALARIANTVFGDNLATVNYAVGNAPVSFPYVWNIWKFDWVQYNASVSQPMARNIGEAMGVGSRYTLVDRYGKPLPPEERFRSTTLLDNLHTIELTLRKLRPPIWPAHVLGPVDEAKAARGKELFNQHCVTCHGPFISPESLKARNAPGKTAADPEWIVKAVCTENIGTDPNTAENFSRATVDITRTGLTKADLQAVAAKGLEQWKVRQVEYLNTEITRLEGIVARGGDDSAAGVPDAAAQLQTLKRELAGIDQYNRDQLASLDPQRLPVGLALSYLGTMIRENAYNDAGFDAKKRAEYDGFGILDLPQIVRAYKPRPLSGAWATAPFLHNGSVPTLYDLLSPADQRPKTFQVGSREFDPVKVGVAQSSGFWEFDTSKPGNSNRGHEFNVGYVKGGGPRNGLIGPLLTHDERMAIIEHLKVRNDDVDGPQEPHAPPPPNCPDTSAPGYKPQARTYR